MFSGLMSRWTIPRLVRGGERTRHLDRDVNSFTQLHSPAHQTLTQRLAFDQFTGYVMNRVILADLVNRQDIWMIESQLRRALLVETASGARRHR